MPVKIPPAQIQNLQQIEAVVAGPDESNRLLIIDGQFDVTLQAVSDGQLESRKETFAVLVGPVFARQQFTRAIATASFTKTRFSVVPSNAGASWQILGVDADWDDESGQVELRIEAQVDTRGGTPNISSNAGIDGFTFHVTILAAVPAA
jgi:hypothetical protein